MTLLIERGDGTRAKFGIEVEARPETEQDTLLSMLRAAAGTADGLADIVVREGVDAIAWDPIRDEDRTVVLE